MGTLDGLIIASLVVWGASEILINLVSSINQLRGLSERSDRFSHLVIWLAIMPPLFLAILVWRHTIFPTGFGSFGALTALLGYLGCLIVIFGVVIRLTAVATLKRQFTTSVTIVAKHELVDTGIYRIIRHPSYLGLLASMFGFGLASGNWFSFAALVALPLAGALYRIRVEEQLLLRRFDPAYQDYARRTKKLLPGIY